VLVGGQAVSVWAERLQFVVREWVAGLLASKDIDFEVSRRAALRAAKLLG
jgi:hypothetical protein